MTMTDRPLGPLYRDPPADPRPSAYVLRAASDGTPIAVHAYRRAEPPAAPPVGLTRERLDALALADLVTSDRDLVLACRDGDRVERYADAAEFLDAALAALSNGTA